MLWYPPAEPDWLPSITPVLIFLYWMPCPLATYEIYEEPRSRTLEYTTVFFVSGQPDDAELAGGAGGFRLAEGGGGMVLSLPDTPDVRVIPPILK